MYFVPRLRRFRHGYAWHIGVLWIELFVPRQRCKSCGFTFTFDYGLGLVHSSTESFRHEIVKHCHGRSIAEVAQEYELPYTTVERWFYLYAPVNWWKKKRNILVSMSSRCAKGTTMRQVC